jgi:hypothetical protein
MIVIKWKTETVTTFNRKIIEREEIDIQNTQIKINFPDLLHVLQ